MVTPVIAIAQKGLIFNKDRSEILVISYQDSDYVPDKLAGKLGLPGGRIEFGEQPDASFIREIQEETGITIIPFLPFYTWTWTYDTKTESRQVVAMARIGIYSQGEITEPYGDNEVKMGRARWIGLSKIKIEDFVADEQPVLREYFEFKKINPFI